MKSIKNIINSKPYYRTTLIYFLFSVLWIFFTDGLTNYLAQDRFDIQQVELIKDFIFVILSALFILSITRYDYKTILKKKDEVDQSEKKFRDLFEKAPASYHSLDQDGNFVDVNNTFTETLGYRKDEILKMNFIELLADKNSRIKYENYFPKDVKFGPVRGLMLSIKKKDGEIIFANYNARLTEDGQNNRLLTHCIFEDVTEKVKVSEELEENEKKYRTIADYNNDWEYWLNDKGNYEYVSPAVEEITGYPPQKFIDDPDFFFKLVAEEDLVRVTNHYKNKFHSTEIEKNLIFKIICKHGKEKYIKHSCRPILDDNGKVIGRRGSNSDITELVEVHTELLNSEDRYKNLIKYSSEGICRFEFKEPLDTSLPIDEQLDKLLSNSYVAEYNDAFAEMYNQTEKNELMNKSLLDLYGNKTDEVSVNANLEFIKNGYKLEEIETKEETIDGKEKWFSNNAIGIIENNKLVRMWSIQRDITEQKITEEALRESEEKFRNIFEKHSAVKFIIDAETGDVVAANQAASTFYGWTTDELTQKNIQQLNTIPADEVEKLIKKAKQNKHLHLEVKHRLKDGSIRDVEIYTGRIDIKNKIYFHSIVHDITEKKKIEKVLKIRSLAVEQSPVSIVVTDTDGNIEYVNPAFEKTSGYSFEEVKGKNPRILQSGLTEQSVFQELWATVTKGKTWSGVFHNKKKDGTHYSESSNISPILDESGNIINYVGVKEDITEFFKAQKELNNYKNYLEELVEKRTNELSDRNIFLKTFIDTIPNPVFVKDRQSNYIEVNKAFCEFFGTTREEVIGTHFELKTDERFYHHSNIVDWKLLENHATRVYETEINVPSKGKIPVMIYKSSFGPEDENPQGVTGLFIDISDRKKTDELMKNALQEEKELNEMKTNFISMASHEFRTPLTAILASADLIGKYGHKWESEKVISKISTIQLSVQQMVDLLEDVLTLSRTDKGKIDFEPARVDFSRLLEDLVEQVNSNTDHSHKIEIQENLKSRILSLDERISSHIIDNLLTNAVKFSDAGSKILIRAEQHDHNLQIVIKDEGIGIPEKELKHIFDPFYRTSIATKIKGTGLGLAIVDRFVQLHQGTISVKSEIGKGTEFTFDLPVNKESVA